MVSIQELDPKHWIQWCPGCGDFGILNAVRKAISDLNLNPKDVVVVSGIGCSGKIPHYIKTYGFEGIHGRTLPVAMGIKLVNPNIKVIVNTGDGDNYGIGLSHWIHNMRRNLDVTHITHNNHIYALTKGQASPTTYYEVKTKSTLHGNPEHALNPIALAIESGATFVARGYAGDILHLSELIKKGLEHRGYAFIDVLQPCPSMNPQMDYSYYSSRIYKLDDANHNPHDKKSAREKAWEGYETDEKIPIGIFYIEQKETLEDYYNDINHPVPVAFQDIENIDIEDILNEYV